MKDPDGQVKTFETKQIFKQHPHISADNHFSGKNVSKKAGEEGFGLTETCR